MSSRKSTEIQETVKDIVQLYLKRRNFYSESEWESEAGGCQPLPQLAADSLAAGAASVPDLLAHSAAQMEPAAAESQFARFRAWVLEAPEPYQAALQQLLGPVFISLHLELVLAGYSPARFYTRHHGPLLGEPLVAQLAGVLSPRDLERSPLRHYRASPPEVALSPECTEYLRRALRSSQLALVLQALSQHVQLSPAAEPDSSRPGRRRYPSGSPQRRPSATGDPGADLARAAAKLRAAPPPPPTICAYRIGRPLACAALTPRLDALVAGDERGAAVWSLSAGAPPPATADNPAARLPLGPDDGLPPRPAVDPTAGTASRPLRAHAGAVYDLEFEPEGAALLTAGEDTTVRAWRTDTWANVCIYRGHSYPVWSLACQRAAGAASHYFVTGSMDRTARLWSYERTCQLRIFAGHTQDVDCVAVHPNGNYVSSASADGTVRLWALTDAAQVRVLSGHRGLVHDLQFSPDGRRLAAAGEDRRVRVYDLGMGAVVAELSAHVAPVTCLLWTPDSGTLVSADRDGAINTWNLSAKSAGERPQPACTFVCPDSAAVRLQYAPHNYLVAVFGQLQQA